MSHATLPSVCLMLVLAAFAACGARTLPASVSQQPPQALDPLTDAEKALAEKIARADSRAADLLGSQATLASVEFLSMKATDSDEPVRHADLLFSRRDAQFGARAIVRLGASPAVVEFTRIDPQSVPLTPALIQDAWKIALSDAGYTKRLARSAAGLRVEALRIYTQDKSDPCFTGQCLYLLVRDGDFYLSNASVVVDLGTRRVLLERSPR